jgi:putative alpha-1,2-mannosidase
MFAPSTIFNSATGFMEARNANGDWAGPDNGWTEGTGGRTRSTLYTLSKNLSQCAGVNFDCGKLLDFVSWNPIHPLQGSMTIRTR